jgi:hypothetical protein
VPIPHIRVADAPEGHFSVRTKSEVPLRGDRYAI